MAQQPPSAECHKGRTMRDWGLLKDARRSNSTMLGTGVLGTVMKIMGKQAMGSCMEGLDDIHKTKIKKSYHAAEVKAKDKPKPIAPPPKAAPPDQQESITKKPALGVKNSAPASTSQEDTAPPQPKTHQLPKRYSKKYSTIHQRFFVSPKHLYHPSRTRVPNHPEGSLLLLEASLSHRPSNHRAEI
ncbi:MAG: hypothetical protein Q9220_006162 [cf. Caloplaca sp. 1 TL-2023]